LSAGPLPAATVRLRRAWRSKNLRQHARVGHCRPAVGVAGARRAQVGDSRRFLAAGKRRAQRCPQDSFCCARRRSRQALPSGTIVAACQRVTASTTRDRETLFSRRGVGRAAGGVQATCLQVSARQCSKQLTRGAKNTTRGRGETSCVRACGVCATGGPAACAGGGIRFEMEGLKFSAAEFKQSLRGVY
jgi:hypothetical protein